MVKKNQGPHRKSLGCSQCIGGLVIQILCSLNCVFCNMTFSNEEESIAHDEHHPHACKDWCNVCFVRTAFHHHMGYTVTILTLHNTIVSLEANVLKVYQ